MSEPAHIGPERVAALANRLRLIQIDFSDESPDVRSEYLAEELERVLAGVVPEQRQPFLKELMARFPTWDPSVEARPAAESEAPARSEIDERELQDPSFLVSRLIDMAPTFSPAERQALVDQLKQAGLLSVEKAGWSEEAAQQLRSKLSLRGDAGIDATRLIEAAALLADFACRLDSLAWAAWRELAPRAKVRRPGSLREALGRFVQAREDVPRERVNDNLEKLRQLTASLISAVRQAGRRFAVRWLARFSPGEIKHLVSVEGRNILWGEEAKCWRKYEQLAGELNQDHIETEIMQAIAEFAELLMKGIGR